MADHPAAWMDEFRPELRQRAAWAMEDSRHFLRSSIYDADEVERFSGANAIARKDQQFWARFATAAAKHGYKKPRINRGGQVIWGIDGFLLRSSPTYFLIVLLAWTLRRIRRPRPRGMV